MSSRYVFTYSMCVCVFRWLSGSQYLCFININGLRPTAKRNQGMFVPRFLILENDPFPTRSETNTGKQNTALESPQTHVYRTKIRQSAQLLASRPGPL